MNPTNSLSLRTTSDWNEFMDGASEYFDVPVSKPHEIALYFMAQEYYSGSTNQQGA